MLGQEPAKGLIGLAVSCGSYDPSISMKRWADGNRVVGGYNLQASPHDLSIAISNTRNAPGEKRRMLCIGNGTFGSERFLAENLDIPVVSNFGFEESQAFMDNKRKINAIKLISTSGKFDVITLQGEGEYNIERIVNEYARPGTVVIMLGIGSKCGTKGVRAAWSELRKRHRPIASNLETLDTGVGVVLIGTLDENPSYPNSPIFTGEKHEAKAEQATDGTPESNNPEGIAGGIEGTANPLEEKSEGSFHYEEPRQGGNVPEKSKDGVDSEAPQSAGEAPWGRKLDGTPMKRKGAPPGGWKNR